MGGSDEVQRQGYWAQAGDEGGTADLDTEGTETATPLTIAELVSELLYSGKTLSEIAGYDDVQIHLVLLRKRDRYGSLLRGTDLEELPPGVSVDDRGLRVVRNPEPYGRMFERVTRTKLRQVGLDDKDLEDKVLERYWQDWLKTNPEFGVGGV